MCARIALEKLRKLLLDNKTKIVLALLPTGYGKSQLFRHNPDLIHRFAHIVHVLPLQALVSDLVCKLRDKLTELDIDVCYQMGAPVKCSSSLCKHSDTEPEYVLKSPLLSCYYTVSTIDSFLLDYFGIPVHQMFRPRWHADVAIFFSHTTSLTILDEVHLALSLDTETKQKETFPRLVAKQLAAVCEVARLQAEHGLKVCILTATLYPTCVKLILETLARYNTRLLNETNILIYAPNTHPYVKMLRETLGSVCDSSRDPLITVEPTEDDDFFRNFHQWHKKVLTVVRQCDITELERAPAKLIQEVCGLYHEIDEHNISENRKLRILFISNTAARAYRLYKSLKEHLDDRAHILLIHGKTSLGSKSQIVKVLEDFDQDPSRLRKDLILVSTQCVEAGLDVDFDILITEPAPAQSLIQRAGRVCRREVRPGLIVVLDPEDSKLLEVAGPYDRALVKATLDYLRYVGSKSSDGILVNFNWRVPLGDATADYLKLLAYVDSKVLAQCSSMFRDVMTESRRVERVLEMLLKFTSEPADVLKSLDVELRGSFIRECMLITLVDDRVGERSLTHVSELFDYMFIVNVDWLAQYLDKVLRLEKEIKDSTSTYYVYVYYVYRRDEKLWLGRFRYEIRDLQHFRSRLTREPLTLMFDIRKGLSRYIRESEESVPEKQEISQVRVVGFAAQNVEDILVELQEVNEKFTMRVLAAVEEL